MNGARQNNEIGLVWADPKASARNLARGVFDPACENPFAVALAESLAEKERIQRERKRLEGRLQALARDEEFTDKRIERQQEALRRYEETGEVRFDLVPECRDAISAEMSKHRRAVNSSVQEEVDALCDAERECGWEFAHRKTDDHFLFVTLRKPLKKIAAALTPMRRFHFEINVRRAVEQLKAPGLPRRSIARRALEIFMMDLRPAQAAMFPLQPAAP